MSIVQSLVHRIGRAGAAAAVLVFATVAIAQPAPAPGSGGAPAGGSAAPAAQPAASPAPAAAHDGDQALSATVVAVQGIVQYRMAEDQPWAFVKQGMVLAAGAELRTGPRSAVQMTIPPNQTLTLDRLGTITVLEAYREASGKINTGVGMKYGRASYKLQTGGVEHETTIRSPAATLSVRGSEVVYQDDAFATYAYGNGNLFFIDPLASDEPVPFGQWQDADSMIASGGSKIAGSSGGGGGIGSGDTNTTLTPGELARQNATIDHRGAFAGRDNVESTFIDQHPGAGGEDVRDLNGLQQFAGHGFAIDSDLIGDGGDFIVGIGASGFVRGQLIWNNGTDLDLFLILPGGAGTVSFGNPTVNFNGGGATAALDHDNLGGIIDAPPNLRVENIVVTGADIPAGNYTFVVDHFSGPAASYTLIVTGDNGQTIATQTGTLSSGQGPHLIVNSPGGSFP